MFGVIKILFLLHTDADFERKSSSPRPHTQMSHLGLKSNWPGVPNKVASECVVFSFFPIRLDKD